MKKIFSVLLFLVVICQIRAEDTNITTMRKMTQRLFPQQASFFDFRLLNDTSTDTFTIKSEGNKIIISGNNANSMAVGLNHYLKNYCLTTISWYKDDPIELPKTLPNIPAEVTIKANVPTRFFLNYCTFGYSMTWWKWSDWEHFIDWMALNGINMPLAITGQEAIFTDGKISVCCNLAVVSNAKFEAYILSGAGYQSSASIPCSGCMVSSTGKGVPCLPPA